MIKHLPNLKKRAIAVEVPEGSDIVLAYAPTTNMTGIFIKSGNTINGTPEDYINGNWTIIGRANELYINNMAQLLKTGKESAAATFKEWRSYCSEQGLTNELILIQE